MTEPMFPWFESGEDLMGFVMNPIDQSNNTPLDPSAVLTESDDETLDADIELTDEDVERLLSGDYIPLGLTAAATPHTGAMIALIPTMPDAERLAVAGGEDEEELHLTMAYLGDAAKIPPLTRERIIESVSHFARNLPVVDADGFGIATFNEKNGEKDTCAVLLVTGDELAAARKRILTDIESIMYDAFGMPEQHVPWIPHVTLAYTNDGTLAQTLGDREGPIKFNVVRVAFGGQETDFPLYDGTAKSDTTEVYPVEEVIQAAASVTTELDAELGEYDGGWEGPLAVEDTDTGDGRMFSGGSLTWGDTVETIHPFQWAPSNLGEHKGSVTAGRIDRIWRDPANPRVIMGKGHFNLNDPDGLRAFRQVRDGFAGGVSIDPDQISDADVELEFTTDDMNPLEQAMTKPTKTIFHAGRIRGVTLVAFPALVEAAIKLTKKSDAPALVASTEPWGALTNEMNLPSEEGLLDGLVASAAFAYVRDIDDVVHRSNCRFLHHEVAEDGEIGLPNLVACARQITQINSGRSFGLTHVELRAAYDHMAQHIIEAGQVAPEFTLQVAEAVTAAVPPSAPLEWFGNPKLTGPTPITVTDDGRVFGHAAAWNSCHTGFADTCVSPPFENDYGYFTTGEVLTAEGHRVAVGQITLGTSHAATRGLSVAKAIDHYGDTGTAVADVTAGTDEHGIWIAGAVRPGASPDHMHALRASALSGDWRRIGGQLRMVALLAVNVPGFPIPRVGTALSAGKQVSLVASGVIDRETMTVESELALLAGSCGVPLGKKDKKMKYETVEAELAALAAEIEE